LEVKEVLARVIHKTVVPPLALPSSTKLLPPLRPGSYHEDLEKLLDQDESGGPEVKTYPNFQTWEGIGDCEGVDLEEVRTELARGKEAFVEGGVVFPNPKMPAEYHLKIKMKPTLEARRVRPYPMSEAKQYELDKILKGQLAKGIIEYASSPYAVQTFLVPKPGGKFRCICDMKAVNQHMVLNSWPLPKIQNIFDSLLGANMFSVIDLRDAFYSIPVHPDSRDYCAFVTRNGSYRYQTAPMGSAVSANWFAYLLLRLYPSRCER